MRGDALEQEVVLQGQTVRIGRGAQNDLLLEDPGKSVSRNHAEIRFQGGRYVLVDLQSQNGIWVSGSRMPQVVLEPNVVATIGPFRLLLETSGDSAGPASAFDEGPAPGGTEWGNDAPSSGLQPPEHAGRSARAAGVSKPWYVQYQKPLIGGAAVLALGGGAWAAFSSRGGSEAAGYVARLPEAEQMIANGECGRALSEIINPALEQSPANAEAVRLAADAEACGDIAPPPEPAVTPAASQEEVASLLQQADEALARRDCDAARDAIARAQSAGADSQRVADLASQASACAPVVIPGNTPPRTAAVPVGGGPAKALTPEDGGLPAFPNETNDNYQGRVQSIQARFKEADATMSAGDLRRALAQFEAVAQTATDRYRDHGDRNSAVADRIRTIRLRLKEQARKIAAAAADLEKRGEFDRAIEEYQRAGQADADLSVADDVARVRAARTAEGERLCQEARTPYAFGRFAEAAALYKRAAELLPTDHPCYATANERKETGAGAR
jgi:tetratricopeptide (TPR) repeat protein